MLTGLNEFIKSALAEDIGEGDATTLATVPETATARAWPPGSLVRPPTRTQFLGSLTSITCRPAA